MRLWKRVKKKDKLRYLEALAEAYPTPLTHTELAARAGVSKPAVTRAKEALRDVCDLRELTYDKFVLRDDAAGAQVVAESYYNNGRIARFIASKYVVALVNKLGIHGELSKAWPAYGEIFDKADTNLMVGYVMSNLALLQDVQFVAKKLRSPSIYFQVRDLERLEPAFQKVKLPIKDEASLLRFLRLRDKWFALLKQELSNAACSMEVLKELSKKERETYEDVYQKTIEHYLRKAFVSLTEEVVKSLDKAIRVRSGYLELGALYNRNERALQLESRSEGRVVGVRVPSR